MKHPLHWRDLLRVQLNIGVNYQQLLRPKIYHIWNFGLWLKILMLRHERYLDTQKFLGSNKALQSIQGELLNNTSKLTEINKHIKRETKK